MAEEIKVGETETLDEDGKPLAPSQEIKPKRTEAETTAFNLKKHAEKAKELGLDPKEILGLTTHVAPTETDEDNTPMTVGMYKGIQKQDAQKTALEMAAGITDEDTRKNVISYLNERIRPSGDAESDFKLALAAASAPKNKQVLEEINRYGSSKRTASGGSAPATIEEEFVPTPEERTFMAPPYNLSKEKIIATRKATAEKR